MTVLLAEDDESIANVVTLILTESGHKVINASDENSFLSSVSQNPHLILMDISLSGVSGADLIKKVKKDPKYLTIPVIIVSANSDTEEIAKKSGADGFLLKPFDLEQLLSVVSTHTA